LIGLVRGKQHFHRTRTKAAGGEHPACRLIRRSGVKADLCDTHRAETFDRRESELAADAASAMLQLDPEVVDETELLERVDGNLGINRAERSADRMLAG
jgi:hypothetical protein